MSTSDHPRQFDDDDEAWRVVAVFETTEVERRVRRRLLVVRERRPDSEAR
jgi:hypothetical protein